MVAISIDGRDSVLTLQRDLGNAGFRVAAKASVVVQAFAHKVEARAKVNAPVDTGNLRNSITTTFALSGLEAIIRAGAHYAPFVEWGTSRMAPQPFMWPALDSVTPEYLAALAKLGDPWG